MQLTANAEQKIISQYITVYQSIVKFWIDKLWLDIVIKYNKSDTDNMLDDCNAHLIEVCDKYLQEHKLPLDRFQLATIVAQLRSQTISELDAPFRVTIREAKHLIQDYLDKNKSKREALERIKNENDALDKEIIARREEQKKKLSEKNVVLVEKPEMPTEISEVGPMGPNPTPKPKKKVVRGTDALAIDNFVLPKY